MTSDVHIGLRVPAELEQAMRLLGERSDRSLSAEVRRALWRHVELEAVAAPAKSNVALSHERLPDADTAGEMKALVAWSPDRAQGTARRRRGRCLT